jgi:hypothetical protein
VIPARHFMDLGDRLRALIERECGPRQVAAVARRGKFAPSYLRAVLSGCRTPRLETLSRILIAIPATPGELFRDED